MSNLVFWGLLALSTAGFLLAPHLIFQVAPLEPQMGLIQKIFYYHVPCSWLMLLSSLLAGVGGGFSLVGGRPWGAWLRRAASECTVVFGVLVLITGPLWAKKAWGHYWIWDARLTTMLILFLTFVAVLLAERYAGEAGQRIASGLALLGAINAPLVYISVKLWSSNHPPTTVVATLTPEMRSALWISLVTFTCFFVLVLWARLRLARLEAQVDELFLLQADRDDLRTAGLETER